MNSFCVRRPNVQNETGQKKAHFWAPHSAEKNFFFGLFFFFYYFFFLFKVFIQELTL
jgi:hypothetical protein